MARSVWPAIAGTPLPQRLPTKLRMEREACGDETAPQPHGTAIGDFRSGTLQRREVRGDKAAAEAHGAAIGDFRSGVLQNLSLLPGGIHVLFSLSPRAE